jgi:hypothetical protein
MLDRQLASVERLTCDRREVDEAPSHRVVLYRQLRPATTPTSTFRIAPVIQLAYGERRKTIEEAMS